jgi:CubicO group peptidase (beta-lactamase class C family)
VAAPSRQVSSIGAVLAAAALAAACVGGAATEPQGEPPPTVPASPSPAPDHSAFVAAVDALAADALRRGPVAGLSIAVFEHGRPVLAKGYGFADLEAGAPATPETSYPLASVTKHVTAALVLRLADQGRLGLDDPLSRFFPQAREPIGVLTLRHLLQHTSGLTRGGPAPRSAALSVIVRGGTARDQGQAWDYSNYNYSLLGLVIEQVTGKDYGAAVREVVAPLGLTGTGYCEDGTAVPGRARDYLSSFKALTPTFYWAQPRFFAAGGLCSTVLDIVRWEQALEAGRIVSRGMLEAMHAPAELPGSVEADYGLGTRMGMTGSRRKLGHTGGGQGNKAVLARYPAEDVTIAVLLNTERDQSTVTATGLEESIAVLFFGPEPAAGGDAAAREDLARYEGEYREGGRRVRVVADGGVLAMRPGWRRRTESRLVPEASGSFVVADDPSLALRFQVRDQRVLGFSRYRNGWFAGVAVRSDGGPGQKAQSTRR